MLVARTLLKEIKAGEFSLAAAARIPILSPSATLATWRACPAETDVASLCGREATSAGNLARSNCSRIDWLVQLPPNGDGRKTVCSACTRAMLPGGGS